MTLRKVLVVGAPLEYLGEEVVAHTHTHYFLQKKKKPRTDCGRCQNVEAEEGRGGWRDESD